MEKQNFPNPYFNPQYHYQCPNCKTIIGNDYSCPICSLNKKNGIPLSQKIFHPSHTLYSPEQLEIIRKKINYLDPKEMQIMKMRAGLNGNPPKSLRFVGEMLELSQEGVRQIEKKALEKIFNK